MIEIKNQWHLNHILTSKGLELSFVPIMSMVVTSALDYELWPCISVHLNDGPLRLYINT